MKRVRKKNILDRIDDSINDKIDEIKAKNKEKKENKKSTKKEVKNSTFKRENSTKFYDYERETKEKKSGIDFDINIDDEIEPEVKKEEKIKNKKNINLFKKNDKKIVEIKEDIHEEDELLKEDNNNEDEDMKKNKKVKKGFNFKKRNDNKKVKNNKKVKEKKVKEKKVKKKRSFWKKLVTFILIIGIIGVLSVSAFLAYIVITCPEYNEDALAIHEQTVVYDMNGSVIAKLSAQKRESITYDKLPQVLIDAIIATEDSRFFQHNGVDLFRFIKATALQLLGKDDAGGASTLTMQTVKNNITKKDSTENTSSIQGKIKKVIRKFQDVYLAVFKVEKNHSKEEILEMYVNDNGLGSSYYGVEEASKYYFGKSASDLTLPEASLIAGLFQAPNRHNPYKDIESATKRRTTVLNLMERHGYITKEEKELAESISIESLLVGAKSEDTKYQGFIDTVVAEIEKLTDPGDGTGGLNPYTVPMLIYTTMNKSIQDGINNIYSSDAKYMWKDDKVQAGIAVVNAETGAIEAVGAGRKKTGINQFNYATQAFRQPGSTAKPVFDYGPGIEYNNFSSYQLFNDEPWTYTNGPRVNNWDGGYHGLVTMRHALQVSRNIPALKAFQQVGPKNSQKFASSLGLDVSLNTSSENYHTFKSGLDNTINEAYSIGGAAEGFTPLDMASAYACFANGGYYIKPHTVTKIVFRDTGEEKEYKYTKERVMKDSTAYIMNNILESAVTSGFNGGANIAGSHVAAKTGTSNYNEATMKAKGLPASAVNDLWTVAYTSKYSVAVWYGYDEANKDYYNDWGGYKDHVTAEVMAKIPKDPVGWKMPSSVVAVTVEKETWPAMLPSANTPANMKVTEYFVRGTQPTEVSPRYLKLNQVKNVATTKVSSNKVTITWDYDMPRVLTDSYLQSYFNNSVYGNQKGHYLNKRKEYNNNTLGALGFNIYKQNEDGSLTTVAFVKDNTYTYEGFGNTTLIIKAEHEKFKANASDGVTVNLNLDALSNDKLTITLNGQSSIQRNIGTYTEDGIRSISYGNMDITGNANLTITYIVAINNETHEYSDKTDLETYINTLPAGTYSINYVINYLGISATKTRSLTLR